MLNIMFYVIYLSLLFTKSHLEEALCGNALSTCQQLLELWKQSYEPSSDMYVCVCGVCGVVCVCGVSVCVCVRWCVCGVYV